MTGSKNLIANPGTAQGTDTQQCHVEQTKIPGKTTTETYCETRALGDQSCQKILSVDVQMSCQPAELFQALDLPRNEVDHVKIFAKCDPAAQSHSYIEMTDDPFGIRGGTVRNATVQVPKDVASIPAASRIQTVGGGLVYRCRIDCICRVNGATMRRDDRKPACPRKLSLQPNPKLRPGSARSTAKRRA